MHHIITMRMTVLRYPEPADAGGGQPAADSNQAPQGGVPAAQPPPQNTDGGNQPLPGEGGDTAPTQTPDPNSAPSDVNPFDFTLEEIPDPAQPAANGDPGDEYVLELGESFTGTDETRSMIASHAKANGIAPDAAGAFVTQVCDSLLASQREADRQALESLKNEWKGEFEGNMAATRRFIADAVKRGGMSREDAQALMNPNVFRLCNVLRGMVGEERTRGAAQAASAQSRQQEMDDIINNPDNPYHKDLFNPGSKGYKAAAEHFNRLAGVKIY